MRTNIELDDELVAKAMKLTGLSTKKATVEEALRRLVRQYDLKRSLDEIVGIEWEGDLDTMRDGRNRDDFE